MIELTSMRRECQYGIPAADQVLFNRFYVTGYSYYYRQAKWTLQIIDPPVVDPDDAKVQRSDNFRKDFRVPEMFREEKADYVGSKYDRGHLVASADQQDVELQNSETFLLTNMSPQKPKMNRNKWRELEMAVRALNDDKKILVTYVVTGPVFYFDRPTTVIGAKNDEVTIPIPHAFYKSILTENSRGRFYMRSFIMDNKDQGDKPLADFRVSTEKVERLAGMELWSQLLGKDIKGEKRRVRRMWSY